MDPNTMALITMIGVIILVILAIVGYTRSRP